MLFLIDLPLCDLSYFATVPLICSIVLLFQSTVERESSLPRKAETRRAVGGCSLLPWRLSLDAVYKILLTY